MHYRSHKSSRCCATEVPSLKAPAEHVSVLGVGSFSYLMEVSVSLLLLEYTKALFVFNSVRAVLLL